MKGKNVLTEGKYKRKQTNKQKLHMTIFFRPEQWERQSIDLLIGFREIEFIDF